MNAGLIEAFPVAANLQRPSQKDQKSDCFVQFSVGNKKYKSKVSKGRGINPIWSDIVNIPISSESQNLEIAVMDSGLFSNKKVGAANVSIQEVMHFGAIDRTLTLVGEKGPVGSLKVGLNFLPPGRRTPNVSPVPQNRGSLPMGGVLPPPDVPIGDSPIGGGVGKDQSIYSEMTAESRNAQTPILSPDPSD